MKTPRIPRKWKWLKPNIFPTVVKKDILSNHYINNSDQYEIRQHIQPVIVLKRQPLEFFSAGKTVAGTIFSIDFRPTQPDEVWELDLMTVKHNEAAAKKVNFRYVVILPTASAGMFIFDESGMSILAAKETPIFPAYHDATPDHSHAVGYRPLRVSRNRYLQVTSNGAWTNGKTATVRALYRIIET